jgi:hypothetical protein
VHGPEPYSHGADAFRTFATAFPQISGLSSKGRLRRRIRGVV